MKRKYMLDFDDPSNWLNVQDNETPEGELVENVYLMIPPDPSGNRLFAMTWNEWFPIDFLTPFHYHEKSYETFFIKSGSLQLHSGHKQCRVEAGSIIHYGPYDMHGLRFHEKVVSRGFFQNFNALDSIADRTVLEEYYPDVRKRMMEARDPNEPYYDKIDLEYLDYEEVPAEQMRAVKHPDRPEAVFELDGIKMKLLLPRRELGGVREMWRFEVEKGYRAESVEFPENRQLFYLVEGELECKVCEDSFVADKECLIDIPRHYKHSLKAKTDVVMYDVGGLSGWYNFLHDYTAVKKNSPEKFNDEKYIANLKKKNKIVIKSFGKE